MFEKRHIVLHQLLNFKVSKSFIKILKKIRIEPRDEKTIQGILRVARSPSKFKILTRLKTINIYSLWLLGTISEDFCVPPVIEAACDHISYRIVDIGLCRLDGLSKTSGNRQRIVDVLKSTTFDGDLTEEFEKIEAKVFKATTFPPPPFETALPLTPITNYSDLTKEAIEMRSCLRSYLSEILEESKYYFSWAGKERASVEFEKNDDGDWVLGDILGPMNDDVTDQAILEIVDHIKGYSIISLGT